MDRKQFFGVTGLFLFLALIIALPLHADEKIEFSWAVLAKTPSGTSTLDFTSTPVLPPETPIKIFLLQEAGSYIYLFLEESDGGVELLYPENIAQYQNKPPAKQAIHIPDSGFFTTTPPPGMEKLHLVAAPHRLTELEQATASYLANPKDLTLRAGVLKQLKLLRRQHSSIAQVTEKGVPIAGTVRTRSLQPEDFEATRVTTTGFYSRVLRIQHD